VRVSPGLADATVLETRVGLRPVSDDDLPIVGPVPEADGVVVATGLGANGLLLGPVTGRLVADLVTGAPPPLDLASFAPARLGPTGAGRPDRAGTGRGVGGLAPGSEEATSCPSP